MSNALKLVFNDEKDFRGNVKALETQMKKMDGHEIGNASFAPLKHSFTDGLYVREIFIPANTFITGKIHNHEHPNFLMSGTVDVITETGGKERLTGPISMISPKGTKRALHSITDLVWITVHHNPENITNTDELEQKLTSETYEEYDLICLNESKPETMLSRIKKFLLGVR